MARASARGGGGDTSEATMLLPHWHFLIYLEFLLGRQD